MRRHAWLLLALCAALAGHARQAQAQTCTATMTPIVIPSVSPIRNVAFTSSGTISVTCNWGLLNLEPNTQVCLNLATGSASASQNPRTLGNGGNRLQYRVADSANANYSPLWGSTATGTTPISFTMTQPVLGTSATRIVTINAQVTPNQTTVPTVNNATTVYTESLVATMRYGYWGILTPQPSCATAPSTYTFTPQISANVINDCTISASPMNFGSQGLLATTVNATASLSVRCTNNDAYAIALNGGGNGTVAARNMMRQGGQQLVPYQLYLDPARTTPWGDGTLGTSRVTRTGTGLDEVITVYGSIQPQAAPVPGTYTDTVLATVYF
ncbi:spore coat protein U domain-containing protein [Bordetella genomosp. 13]|uniref:Csu type fimbrial protein n=1 Tax=Bordetella genomosp. 13 TaxID=463040 RepID=UPI0016433E38|nr:spore coat U domain-containing protein [Bordetella genomosp. 13]